MSHFLPFIQAARTASPESPKKAVQKRVSRSLERREDPQQTVACEGFVSLVRARLGAEVTITWTRNASTMISFQKRAGHFHVRLQALFSKASQLEADALIRYLRGERRAVRILMAYVTQACADQPLELSQRRRAHWYAQGKHHDLQRYFDTLNACFFEGRLSVSLTWGRASRAKPRRQRSLQLGCYVHELHLIRIHPALDQAFVPDYVVEGVVFHEMIHAHLGPGCGGAQRRMHPPEFVAFERKHPAYLRCCDWERQNIGRLLRYRAGLA